MKTGTPLLWAFQLTTQETWVLLLRQLEAHLSLEWWLLPSIWSVLCLPVNAIQQNMLWGKTGIYAVLPSGKRGTLKALRAKGHRGLPKNPAELREAFNFPKKLHNWIQVVQVEQCPAARSSVYANERTQVPRTVTVTVASRVSLSHS